MASKPNLERARRRIESMMSDNCTVKRDPEQETDDVLDAETGSLAAPDPDDLYVYQGKCMVKANSDYRAAERGGETVALRSYDLYIPTATPALRIGDVVTITASERDSRLVDEEFIVTDIVTATFTVAQQAELARA